MNQVEKRVFLIKRLLDEDRRYRGIEVPADAYEQKRMLRSLMNIRRPQSIDFEFLTVQDDYLRQEIEDAGITHLTDLEPVCGDLYLWQGDITRLQCGAILNDIRRCQIVQIYNKVASTGIGHGLCLLQEIEIEFLNETISKLSGDCTLLRADNELPHLVLVGEDDIRKIDLNTAVREVDRIQIDLLDVI